MDGLRYKIYAGGLPPGAPPGGVLTPPRPPIRGLGLFVISHLKDVVEHSYLCNAKRSFTSHCQPNRRGFGGRSCLPSWGFGGTPQALDSGKNKLLHKKTLKLGLRKIGSIVQTML